MLVPLTSGVTGRPGRRSPAPALHRRRPAARAAPAPPPTPCPARAGSPPPRRSQLAPALRRDGPARRPALLGRPARGRRPAGHRPSPARPRRTAPTSAPAPGCCPRPGPRVELRDELTGETATVPRPRRRQRHRRLGRRPGRRGHPAPAAAAPTWCSAARPCPGLQVAVLRPVPGATNRFVMVLPQPDGTLYVGLTDEPVDGDDPRRARADRGRDRVPARRRVGGVRPRRCAAATWSARTPGCGRCSHSPDGAEGATADLSRRHAVLTSRTGVVTVVGGKLTTYRRMAEDAVDAAVAHGAASTAGPCRTRDLPLLGAAPARRAGRARGAGPAGPPLRHRRRAGARRRPARSAGSRRRAARADRRRRARHARRAALRRHPRGRRRRRRPARPADPDRPGPRRPRRSPYPPPSAPWRSPAAARR